MRCGPVALEISVDLLHVILIGYGSGLNGLRYFFDGGFSVICLWPFVGYFMVSDSNIFHVVSPLSRVKQ